MGFEMLDDFEANILNYSIYGLIVEHHLLMVALDLDGISGLNKLGEMHKYFNFFALFMRIQDVFEIFKISDIHIIFCKIPTIEFVITGRLLNSLENSATYNHHILLFFVDCVFVS